MIGRCLSWEAFKVRKDGNGDNWRIIINLDINNATASPGIFIVTFSLSGSHFAEEIVFILREQFVDVDQAWEVGVIEQKCSGQILVL